MLCRYATRLARPVLSTRTNVIRRLCMPPPEFDEEAIKKLLMLADEKNKPTREVIVSQTGEELVDVSIEDSPEKSHDWDEFERRCGIYDATEEEIDRDWELLTKESNIRVEYVEKKGSRSKRARPFSRNARKTIEGRNFSIEFVDDDDENLPHSKATAQPTEEATVPKPERTRNLSGHFSHTAAEMAEAEYRSEQTSVRQGAKKVADPIYEQVFAETDALKQPAHQKRPGFERRVMSMERQMERIVEDVLCAPGSEWNTAGGDMERVMLSPNMKNLTIYYNADESRQDAEWWKKMNTKYAGVVRAALASRLETKYVPRVFFDEGRQISGKADELDALFRRIESERAEPNISKPGDK